MATASQIGSIDPVIIVMGPTGAGKSTLINYATNGRTKGAGHTLQSYTTAIEIVKAEWLTTDNQNIYFVDTPGFDDTYKSDIEILTLIAEFFIEAHRKRLNIHAILYLHRINDNRMAGSPLKNLELFANLCGNISMPRVVIVTTMWSLVRKDIGSQREEELRTLFWKDMMDKGCHLERFEDSLESVQYIINVTKKIQKPVLLSDELVNRSKRLYETHAGLTLNKQLEKLISDRKKANRQLKEASKHQSDPAVRADLEAEMTAINKMIVDVAAELRELNLPLPKMILRWLGLIRTSEAPQVGPR